MCKIKQYLTNAPDFTTQKYNKKMTLTYRECHFRFRFHQFFVVSVKGNRNAILSRTHDASS